MAVEDMRCWCKDCGWRGVVGDCGSASNKWSYITCPECASSLIVISNRGLSEDGVPQPQLQALQNSDAVSPEETKVLQLLAKVWDVFLQLPAFHNDDVDDFRFAIHAAQNIILARICQQQIALAEYEGNHVKDVMAANLGETCSS